MMFFIIPLIVLLFVLLFALIFVLGFGKKNRDKTKQILMNLLEERGFFAHEILIVNRILILAINKDYSKLAIFEYFHPDRMTNFAYNEIATVFITGIEKNNFNIKINYIKKGDKKTIYLAPVTKHAKEFVYDIFKKTRLKKIEIKFPSFKFKFSSASNWDCEYVWAYSPKASSFAYYNSNQNEFRILSLRKEYFTIDTKYNYLELSLSNQRQQLFVFEPSFLDMLFSDIFYQIKQKTTTILENYIYYDHYANILYLSNGTSSLQSLLLDNVQEVCYKDNTLSFYLFEDEKTVNFKANWDTIKAFEDFITGYNLKKIARNFDYKSDKLINTTPNTKFIIDVSRDRAVYCANLDRIAKFSYLTISFDSIDEVVVENPTKKPFVRIFTKGQEAIDISCSKPEVAYYICSQMRKILE